nr:FAD-dependent oxidoreductase [Candidatus Saccharibacteria bacterium]NIV04351.1 FAD-dependent oxidoreductase [Calditrichia bacterium]NIS38892.1 FAD-dependent oxidoreductase [Candidatus Saccharibacteria bacterium]NIV72876.1 FAD-dependent oxidoreductase [Calditrichia bacterium]NIW00092.1 FAD-dependent oxidoreductase [Candidatus Saccharibacteria bacterium]
MLDCIIIGAGPAGMAAAIYMARQKLDFIVVSKTVGGQTLLSWEVGNYLGFQMLPGDELVKEFKKHMADYKIKIQEGEEVKSVNKTKTGFKVKTDKAEYEARTLLVSTGSKHRKLGIPGEDEFYGKGVTYCAACDAPLFGDKDVAVVGGGNSAMESALFASKYSKNIYILNINPELTGDDDLIARVKKDEKIEIIPNAKTTEITGDKFVTGLKYKQDDEVKGLAIQGVFIEIGLIPVSEFIDIVKKD